MELLSLDKFEIFIKKFEHFLAMLFQNCARLLNILIHPKKPLTSYSTAFSKIVKELVLQLISANAPRGKMNFGSVCPKFILYRIGVSSKLNSPITFKISSLYSSKYFSSCGLPNIIPFAFCKIPCTP